MRLNQPRSALAAQQSRPATLDLPPRLAYRSEKAVPKSANVISQKAKYAFKALVVLARRGRALPCRRMRLPLKAAIPRKFLEQILLQLKANGLVASRRGRAGGYLLVADPAAITVSQVLRIVDGPIAPLTCISRTAYARCKDCPDETHCARAAALCGNLRRDAAADGEDDARGRAGRAAGRVGRTAGTGRAPRTRRTQSTCCRNAHFGKAFLQCGLH